MEHADRQFHPLHHSLVAELQGVLRPMRVFHQLSDLFNESLAKLLRRIPSFEGYIVSCSRLLYRLNGVPFVEVLRERLRRVVTNQATTLRDRYRTVELLPQALMTVDITGWMSGLYFDGQLSFERQTTEFIKAHLPPGGTFVDVGANVGYFSILSAGLVGSRGRVYAFEPNPKLRDDFMRSVAINSFEDRILLTEIALSNQDLDGVDFFVSLAGTNTGLSTLTPYEGHLATGTLSLTHKITVPARKFDSWIKEMGLTHIDILKIDVEGAEELVLAGMQDAFATVRPPYIICETNLRGAVTDRLSTYGYRASSLDTENGWGNILYSRGGNG